MLEVGLGTCIEQAKMIKYFFDKMGFENKLYCYRSYETEENFDKDIRMHCFVLFKNTEIDSIPSGLTFKEFNNFVNEFDDTKRKKI